MASATTEPFKHSTCGSTVFDLNPLNPDLLFTSPDGYESADFIYTSVPEGAPSGSGTGLTATVDRNHGLTIYCPVLSTGPGVVLVQCAVYTTGPDAKLALAALNAEGGDTWNHVDWSLASNQPTDASSFQGHWRKLDLYYDPDGDAIATVFQTLGTTDKKVRVYVDRITVTPLCNLSSGERDAALNLPPVIASVRIVGNEPKLYADELGRRTRTIVATMDSPVSGIAITFEVEDPDDPARDSTLDPNGSAGFDNEGPLALLDGFSGPVTVFTEDGAASVTFSTDSRVGGDNYRVSATSQSETLKTEVMTVWRKMFIEYDVMEPGPPEEDFGGAGEMKLHHHIHENYLHGNASPHGLKACLEAFPDGSFQPDRNVYITPVFDPNPPVVHLTPYHRYMSGPLSNICIGPYDYDNRDSDHLHFFSIHSWRDVPWLDGVGGWTSTGFGNDLIFIAWDRIQYAVPHVDEGDATDIFTIVHEIGHALGRGHHEQHGQDDVAGAPGHDCVMTQGPAPALNPAGQTTKRFGPKCVRAIRNLSYNPKWLK